MDVVQVFNDEIQSLLDTKPPVSKAKMGLITRAAMKGVKFYKHIVQSVERFIAKCRPEYKVPGLYVIDSIVRQSRHQFGVERDVYATRFARNLQQTFNHLFTGCSSDDRPKIVRVLNLWQKNVVFNSQVIQPLLDMAHPNSAHNLSTESNLSNDSSNLDSGKQPHASKHQSHHFSSENNNPQHAKNSGKHYKTDGDKGSRFSKSMLDFDYDEDDDDDGDETPTEAEPPLSSTLNKIEKEQRSRNDILASNQLSGQLHHQQTQHQQKIASSQLNLMRNDQDPVLERWNRLIRQQSITNDGSKDSSINENRQQRDRSRSPPVREKTISAPIKEPPKPRMKSPVEKSAEWAAERKVERDRKCLPAIKDKHLTVCSSTLWLGHVPKTVSEADISDAFGEFGAITSIDLIPPRGCAYVCMDRRQDAKKALSKSRDLKLNGSHIKMAWAPGKGFKEYKKLKDFWEVDKGSSYIPYAKIDSSIDFDILEEGGVIDEDSMSMEMRETRERKAKEKEEKTKEVKPNLSLPVPALPILAQPPSFTIPPPNLSIPPPATLSQGGGLGGIPFPPPNVAPPNNQMPTQQVPNIFDNSNSLDHDNNEVVNSPSSLDQQLSMTERQINMVEQQLSMIQQVQGMGQPQQAMAPIHPQALFHHQGHTNPLLFEMPPPQMLYGGPPPTQLIDSHQAQQIPIFANPPPLLNQPPPMLPVSQPNINQTMNGDSMKHYGPRY